MKRERAHSRIRTACVSAIVSLASQGATSFAPNGNIYRCSYIPAVPSLQNDFDNNQFQLNVKRPKKNGVADGKISKKKKKGFQTPATPAAYIHQYQQGTMDTALCIIPPDDAWDTIQRARHFAKDPSFYTWPPAIRLFHPFVERASLAEVASTVAQVVEMYELESFEITIDKLLIVPHFEDLQEQDEAMKQLPDQATVSDREPTKDEIRVQELILSEEQKGKTKLAKRKAKEQAMKLLRQEEEKKDSLIDREDSSGGFTCNDNTQKEVNTTTKKDQSPREMLKEQRKSMSQFNGPCVLCLEPNEESKIHIQAFREILRKKLFAKYDPFSPSSIVTSDDILQKGLPRTVLRQHGLLGSSQSQKSKQKKREGSTFRPMITLGSFSTVTKAVATAKKLQSVWEPLTFQVSDLHVVSKLSPSTLKSEIDKGDDGETSSSFSSSDPYSIEVDDNGTPSLLENRELTLRKFHGSDGSDSILTTKGEYGCDGESLVNQ